MAVEVPTIDQLRQMADRHGLRWSRADLAFIQGAMVAMMAPYGRLDELEEPSLPVRYGRDRGYRPGPEENPHNAWYWKCSIKGASTGPLVGKRIAVKDIVAVAGIPTMCGCSALEGYIPEFDATIVSRILDAGGEIAGKAVCQHLCCSTPDTGPVLNPHDHGRSASASSSGSAALVAAGEVDMAIGSDQGGSVRMPSSWCGVYGLKPTYGLVPYTGVMSIDHTLDTLGPMAANVSDVALLLDAIAGEDGLDPRQKDVRVDAYAKYLTGNVRDMRIGILEEGFGWPVSEPDVDKTVREAAYVFEELGARVSNVSVPMHRDGVVIFLAIALEGMAVKYLRDKGLGTNWKGHYCGSLAEALGRVWNQPDLISDFVWMMVLIGEYMQDKYHGRYYAKAQNLSRVLTKAYEDALQSVDLLLLPTMTMKAIPYPSENAPREERFGRDFVGGENTSPFNPTELPAMSIPCGESEGLPVGMMLVGKKWDEGAILRAAYAFEQTKTYKLRAHRQP